MAQSYSFTFKSLLSVNRVQAKMCTLNIWHFNELNWLMFISLHILQSKDDSGHDGNDQEGQGEAEVVGRVAAVSVAITRIQFFAILDDLKTAHLKFGAFTLATP